LKRTRRQRERHSRNHRKGKVRAGTGRSGGFESKPNEKEKRAQLWTLENINTTAKEPDVWVVKKKRATCRMEEGRTFEKREA